MQHISFSELKNWAKCAFYHKLVNIDKLKGFVGSEHTAFGTALHEVCEKGVLGQLTKGDEAKLFLETFEKEIASLIIDKVSLEQELVTQMEAQGVNLAPLAVPALTKKFGDYKVISAEEKLYEPIEEVDYFFLRGISIWSLRHRMTNITSLIGRQLRGAGTHAEGPIQW